MPYILLAIGCLIGLYALYRFFLNADVRQIKALFLSASMVTLSLALFYMAISGRLVAALGLVVALTPVILSIFKQWRNENGETLDTTSETIKTRADALEVLGLQDGANEKEIKAAYKKLMQKVHPDHEGSEWMAAKLNQARDLLLNK